MLCALASLVWTFWTSYRNRIALAVPGGDPWNGSGLEWSTPAPVPEWTFPRTPHVTKRNDWGEAKRAGDPWKGPDNYTDIELPANTALGLLIAGASFALGFAMVWHIWWLAVLCALAIPGLVALRGMRVVEPRIIPAADVEEADRRFRQQVASLAPVRRADEETERNRGVPDLTEFAG